MKKTSVFINYIIILLSLVLVLFVIFNTIGTTLINGQLMKRTKAQMLTQANEIKRTYLEDYYAENRAINYLMDRLDEAGELSGKRIWVVSTTGIITVDSERSAQYVVIDKGYMDMIAEGTIENFMVPGLVLEPVLCVAVPITYDYITRGYLVLMETERAIEAEASYYSDYLNICYFIFVPALILAFFVIYMFSVYPVNKLTKQVKEYANANFNGEFNLKYPAELSELGGTIRFMGDKLNGNDVTQRAFLSNVSHDFRSPLTSIHGYIEAMKDGTIPVEQQDKYFDILLYETERLTKLTSNILQLNNIDDNGLMINKTIFDINKMIKQIALTFEGTFKKKKLVLNLVFSQKETFVEADADRIQQVIYNLIDNAVKFSNTDSSIKVTTEEKGSKVYITVKDHGMGIPKDSINKIWDRFYKTDQSRGRDKKGSGLGLAIVREIIKAHGQNISCVSTEGVGTEFMFTLKAAE